MEYENYLNENILQNDTKIKKKKKLKKKLKNFENKNDIEIYDFISASFYLRNKKVLSPFSKFSLVIVLCLKMHRSCLNGHVLFAGHVTNIGGRKS